MWVMMSNHALSFNDHFFCTGWQTMPVFVFNIIYKPLLTSGTRVFLFNIMLTEVDTFTSITHHYSNAITQFITQFITQIPLLKSLLIITQMSFSLLIITPPLLKGHFADARWSACVSDSQAFKLCCELKIEDSSDKILPIRLKISLKQAGESLNLLCWWPVMTW